MQQHIWSTEPELAPRQLASMASEQVDGDMDMMDASDTAMGGDQFEGQEQQHLEPGPFQPDTVVPNIAGRMPTPIHCSFAAQVRGSNYIDGGPPAAWEDARFRESLAERKDANIRALGSNGMLGIRQNSGMLGDESVPRSLDGPAAAAQVMEDWNMVQNRRLPSPISESGGEENLESPRMVLDSSSQQMGQLSLLTHSFASSVPPRSSSAGEMGQGQQGVSGSPQEDTLGANSAMDIESPATPSPRKGHTRSRHTVNSWTALQPGMKRAFSIGYRADCEKCRMKVPGHFNHIIIS